MTDADDKHSGSMPGPGYFTKSQILSSVYEKATAWVERNIAPLIDGEYKFTMKREPGGLKFGIIFGNHSVEAIFVPHKLNAGRIALMALKEGVEKKLHKM